MTINRPFTNVRNLIEIRNFLMHYKREWLTYKKEKRLV